MVEGPVEVVGERAGAMATGSRGRGAVVGALTAAVALGTAELIAGLVGPASSPILAVGSAMIDASPEGLKSFAIRTFGEHDKLALVLGIGVFLLLAALVLGAASVRR